MIKEDKISNRIYYLDFLRVISCLSVILIHTSAEYVIKDFGSLDFWIGNIFDSVSRIGVPIFVMISGALFLDENYKYSKEKIKKHIKKMIIFFIFWSGIYCILFGIIEPIIIKKESINILQITSYFFSGYHHLWFVYLIIGLYLIVPLLRIWVKDKNKKYVEYFFILSIIFTYIIPQIISIGANYFKVFNIFEKIINNYLNLKYIGGYTTYFILGWYINNYDIKNKRIIYFLGGLSILINIFGTYILSATTGRDIQLYDNISLNVLLQCIMIFVFIKTKYVGKIEKKKYIVTISKYSLGIYAIHQAIVTIIYNILNSLGLDMAIINIPINAILSFAVSLASTYVISKIPILKKVV